MANLFGKQVHYKFKGLSLVVQELKNKILLFLLLIFPYILFSWMGIFIYIP